MRNSGLAAWRRWRRCMARKAEEEKYDVLIAVLAESGKTVDDLLEELKR